MTNLPNRTPPRTREDPAALLWLDCRGHVVEANPIALRLLELPLDALTDRPLLTLVHGDAPYLARLLTERRWLDVGHDAIWSAASFERPRSGPVRCLVRVRRASPADAGPGPIGYELRLETQHTTAPRSLRAGTPPPRP